MKITGLVLALIVLCGSVLAASKSAPAAADEAQTNLVFAAPNSFGQITLRVRDSEHKGRKSSSSSDTTTQTSYGELDVALDNLTPATTYVLRVQYTCYAKSVSSFGRDRKRTIEAGSATSSVTTNGSKRLELIVKSSPYTSIETHIPRAGSDRTEVSLDGWDVTIWLNDCVVMQAVRNKKAVFYGLKGSDSL